MGFAGPAKISARPFGRSTTVPRTQSPLHHTCPIDSSRCARPLVGMPDVQSQDRPTQLALVLQPNPVPRPHTVGAGERFAQEQRWGWGSAAGFERATQPVHRDPDIDLQRLLDIDVVRPLQIEEVFRQRIPRHPLDLVAGAGGQTHGIIKRKIDHGEQWKQRRRLERHRQSRARATPRRLRLADRDREQHDRLTPGVYLLHLEVPPGCEAEKPNSSKHLPHQPATALCPRPRERIAVADKLRGGTIAVIEPIVDQDGRGRLETVAARRRSRHPLVPRHARPGVQPGGHRAQPADCIDALALADRDTAAFAANHQDCPCPGPGRLHLLDKRCSLGHLLDRRRVLGPPAR